MGDSIDWSMDRVAAHSLLVHLKLEATADNLELVAEHFARHRKTAFEWAAERVHAYIVGKLESASMIYFARESAEWSEGFRFAEQQIFTTTADDLLQLGSNRKQTRGQILRGMVRRARIEQASPDNSPRLTAG